MCRLVSVRKAVGKAGVVEDVGCGEGVGGSERRCSVGGRSKESERGGGGVSVGCGLRRVVGGGGGVVMGRWLV